MRIATIAGSLRSGSYNRKLLALAEAALIRTGADVDHLDLHDFPLPSYNGDQEREHGLPEPAWKLQSRIAACQGVLIASPEYNGGIPGVFKNVLDWTSRGPHHPWSGKVIALMGATSGLWGTQRMMPQLRQAFQILGAHVIPQQINVREAAKVWDESGQLLDDRLPERIETFAQEFLRIVERLKQIE
ncbi:MAG: NADPH-dependent FMN reductase [Calditrichota bacterium]